MNNSNESDKLSFVFFGPPGVGKSTVGRIVSSEFGFDFYEGDEEMTPEERKLVATGQWGDNERRALLHRTAREMNRLFGVSETGLITSLAMTKEWMRELLSQESEAFLHFVLVMAMISQEEMEEKVAERHAQGHPITVDAFRRYTSAFDQPKEGQLTILNPHNSAQTDQLIEQMAGILKKLRAG